MPTYNTVSFDVETTADGVRNTWSRRARITQRAIPGGNKTDTQYTGLENYSLTVLANLASESAMLQLVASVGITKRVLNVFGTDYANTMLIEVTDPVILPGGRARATLRFSREG